MNFDLEVFGRKVATYLKFILGNEELSSAAIKVFPNLLRAIKTNSYNLQVIEEGRGFNLSNIEKKTGAEYSWYNTALVLLYNWDYKEDDLFFVVGSDFLNGEPRNIVFNKLIRLILDEFSVCVDLDAFCAKSGHCLIGPKGICGKSFFELILRYPIGKRQQTNCGTEVVINSYNLKASSKDKSCYQIFVSDKKAGESRYYLANIQLQQSLFLTSYDEHQRYLVVFDAKQNEQEASKTNVSGFVAKCKYWIKVKENQMEVFPCDYILKCFPCDCEDEQRWRSEILNEYECFFAFLKLNNRRFFGKKVIDNICFNTAYMLMPNLGEALSEITADKLGGVENRIRLTIDLLKQVMRMHASGYIHCDIKPQNCVVYLDEKTKTTAKKVFLVDYGLARARNEQSRIKEEKKLDVGTLLFLAPELPRQGMTIKFDIYCLGIVLMVIFGGDLNSIMRPREDALSAHKKGAEFLCIGFDVSFLDKLPEQYSIIKRIIAHMVSDSPMLRPNLQYVCVLLHKLLSG